MEKKEFKVGEVFTAGLVRLKCVEGDTCDRCIFENYNYCSCTESTVEYLFLVVKITSSISL